MESTVGHKNKGQHTLQLLVQISDNGTSPLRAVPLSVLIARRGQTFRGAAFGQSSHSRFCVIVHGAKLGVHRDPVKRTQTRILFP